MHVAIIGQMTVRKIEEPSGDPRVRPYTASEVDAWTDETVMLCARRLRSGRDCPPMLLTICNSDSGLIHTACSLRPHIRARKQGIPTSSVLAAALGYLRAFALIRIEPISQTEMLVAFETLRRCWTRMYRADDPPVVIANEVGSKSQNGFGAMIFTQSVN